MRDEDDIILRDILLMLWRGRLLILGCFLVVLATVAIALSFVDSRYTARAVMMIEDTSDAMPLPAEFRTMQTIQKHDVSILNDMAVMQSRSFAQDVVRSHNTLNALIVSRPQGYKTRQSFKHFAVTDEPLKRLPPAAADSVLNHGVNVLLSHLSVRNVPGSSVIHIEYTSSDPVFAADIANAVADTYIRRRKTIRQEKTNSVNALMDKRLKALETDMIIAEKTLQDYKAEYDIVGSSNDLTLQAAIKLNNAVQSVTSQKDDAAIRLNTLTDQSDTVQNNQTVARLQAELAAANAGIAELETRYGAKHPKMIKALSERTAITRNLETAIGNVAAQVKNDVQRASAKLETVTDAFDDVKKETVKAQAIRIGLEMPERNAQRARDAYHAFLQTVKRVRDGEALSDGRVRILSYAVTPQTASYPNTSLFLSLSAIMALFAGVGLVFMRNGLDNTYRDPRALERDVGLPCHTVIQAIPAKEKAAIGAYIVNNPVSAQAEAVKALKTDLMLKQDDNASVVICIASSLQGEGKTTLALWLARSFAKSGTKTILVEGDLRRPQLHKRLNHNPDAGLTDVLSEQCNLNTAVTRDLLADLDILTGASVPNTALDTLASPAMKTLMRDLRDMYQVIIIDTPAVLPVTDARVLSHYADDLLYVVAAHETARHDVARGIKLFDHIAPDHVRLIFNKFKL